MSDVRARAVAAARSSRRLAAQRGYTLIELSVAILIALFLLGALFAIVQSTQRTSINQNGLAQLQDNERLAITMMTDVIQDAGYYPNPTVNTASLALPAGGVFATAGQGLYGVSNASAQGDSITVRYLTSGSATDNGAVNCTGGTNTSGAALVYTNEFSVDASGDLLCSVNGAAPVVLIPGGTSGTQTQGLQSLQIYYGVNTDPTNIGADSYLKASEMSSADWLEVRSVQIILTFINPLASQPGQPATIEIVRTVSVMGTAGVDT